MTFLYLRLPGLPSRLLYLGLALPCLMQGNGSVRVCVMQGRWALLQLLGHLHL